MIKCICQSELIRSISTDSYHNCSSCYGKYLHRHRLIGKVQHFFQDSNLSEDSTSGFKDSGIERDENSNSDFQQDFPSLQSGSSEHEPVKSLSNIYWEFTIDIWLSLVTCVDTEQCKYFLLIKIFSKSGACTCHDAERQVESKSHMKVEKSVYTYWFS